MAVMGEVTDNFDLPRLNPLLRLYQAPQSGEGVPSWTIHDPLSNSYYRIGWAEFECLARFSLVKDVQSLKAKIENETTLQVDINDIKELVKFLSERGLLALQDQKIDSNNKKKTSFLKRVLHGYLFFSMPLVNPEKFLKQTLPFVKPLMSRTFIYSMLGILIIGIFMTLQRADEFFHTFTGLMSWEGIVTTMMVFGGIKIIHELSHAYTAIRYGVPVPHMGVAMIVMYPVLYTEVTGSLRLASKKERFYIGVAGIAGELYLATLFLLLWNYVPYGSAWQGIAFSVVAISMVGSLLINLNPLMRFDGYYLLSDYLGIENLHTRACAFAQWKIRQVLFALNDPPPEYFTASRQNFLVIFGMALLLYRLLLYFGIAVLVYHVFFKPLGFVMMMVELIWFIALPVYREMSVWYSRRAEIVSSLWGKCTLGVMLVGCFMLIIPVQQVAVIPAVMHAQSYRDFYPSAPAQLTEIYVQEGQTVHKGDVLARLESAELMHNKRQAQQKLANLQAQKRRGQAQISYTDQGNPSSVDEEIAAAQVSLDGIEKQIESLWMRAPFDGTIRDLAVNLYAGQYVKKRDVLFRLVQPNQITFTGYFNEGDLGDLQGGDDAVFYPDNDAFVSIPVRLDTYDEIASHVLPWPALSSVHGGPVPTQRNPEDGDSYTPLTGLYAALFMPVEAAANINGLQNVQTGRIRVVKPSGSMAAKWLKKAAMLIWEEGSLN
jgi:putative peptide zinc metalloprotease protein